MRSGAENKYGSGLSGVHCERLGPRWCMLAGWLAPGWVPWRLRLHRRCNLAARAGVVVHVPYSAAVSDASREGWRPSVGDEAGRGREIDCVCAVAVAASQRGRVEAGRCSSFELGSVGTTSTDRKGQPTGQGKRGQKRKREKKERERGRKSSRNALGPCI